MQPCLLKELITSLKVSIAIPKVGLSLTCLKDSGVIAICSNGMSGRGKVGKCPGVSFVADKAILHLALLSLSLLFRRGDAPDMRFPVVSKDNHIVADFEFEIARLLEYLDHQLHDLIQAQILLLNAYESGGQ